MSYKDPAKHREYNRRWRIANRKKHNASQKRVRQKAKASDPLGFRESENLRLASWRSRNFEKAALQAKRMAEKHRAWRESNPEASYAAECARYDAKKNRITDKEWERAMAVVIKEKK